MEILEKSLQAWARCDALRRTRRRLINYTYGRQWEDLVSHSVYGTVTERNYMELTHRMPLTNNLIRSLVKCVVGRFRYNLALTRRASADDSRPDLFALSSPPLPGSIAEANLIDELDARMLEEFLISGCAIQHISVEGRPVEGVNVWVDNVSPDRFFCNRFLDPRGSDLRLLGMLHDMSYDEMLLRFGRTEQGAKAVEEACDKADVSLSDVSSAMPGTGVPTGFGHPSAPDRYRVVETWTHTVTTSSAPRRTVREAWVGRFFTPEGVLLKEMESPFAHRSHPFVVKFYPLTDGEVHPFLEDVIDQQRHINRLISEIDNVLAHSAKGALLMPTDAMLPDISLAEHTALWSQPGAVIPFNGNARHLPIEVHPANPGQGSSQLLDIEMRMFHQISGVSAALSGESVGNSTSASMYDAQVTNSTIALLDIFQTFNSFRAMRDAKVLQSRPLG